MNINNEQRKALAGIVEANGRGTEFYLKFGQPKVAKNRAKAQALLDITIANDKKLEGIRSVHRNAERTLDDKVSKELNALSDKQRDEVRALEAKQSKAYQELKLKLSKGVEALSEKNEKERKALEHANEPLENQIKALGYRISYEYQNGTRTQTIEEDTTVTSADYEMFKKRALADIWSVNTLEEAKKAIDRYLNLEK